MLATTVFPRSSAYFTRLTRAWTPDQVYGDRDIFPRELILHRLSVPNAERIFFIRHALRAGFSIEEIFQLTKIDRWFLVQIEDLLKDEAALRGRRVDQIDAATFRKLKRKGFSDRRLAYLMTMVKRSSIFQLQRYKLIIDGKPRSIRAAEVMISNTTLLEKPPFLFGPPETLNDGQFDIYVLTAQTLRDYIGLVWSLFRRPGQTANKLSHLAATRSVRIEADHSRLVQADGEVTGHTPVEVKLIPKAIHVIMPRPVPVPAAS